MTEGVILVIALIAAAPLRVAEPSSFSAGVAAANCLSSSQAYQQYEQSKFWPASGTAFANAMVACTKTLEADVTFDCVFIVSAGGHIKRILHVTQQPMAACVAAQLSGRSLPRPPRDAWPVLVHMSTHR